MKATVTSIETHYREYVTVTLRGDTYGLYLRHHPELIHKLQVGEQIQVKRQVNNPFLIPIAT